MALEINEIWDIYLRSPDGNTLLRTGLSEFEPGYPGWVAFNEGVITFRSLTNGDHYQMNTVCLTYPEGCSPYVELTRSLDPAPTPTPTLTPWPAPTSEPANQYQGWIVYTSIVNENTRATELFLLAPDGSKVIPFGLELYSPRRPAWSHDGQRIVFVSGGNLYSLFVGCVDLPEGCLPHITNIIESKGGDRFWSASWSPDSSSLVAMYEHENRDTGHHYSMVVIDVSESEMSIIGNSGWEPNWGLDNETIVFMETPSDTSLSSMNVDGSAMRSVFDAEEIRLQWAWSPDRRSIAFHTNNYFDPDILVMDLGVNEIKYLINGINPAWSPSGEMIAFSDLSGIHLFDLSDGSSKLIFKARIFELAWSP